jgi:hypothetical protein
MAKVASALLREAFIEPIRFALLLDDKFPTYPALAGNQFDGALDNARAKALFDLCRGRGWLCDIENRGAVAEEFEVNKHLHQSDLLILDFNLDPLDQDDPTAALRIIQRLAASDHFNLVIVYTNADPILVVRDIAFALGGGSDLSQVDEAAALEIWEELDDGVDAIEQALNWATIDDYLRDLNPRVNAADLRAQLGTAGVMNGDQAKVVTRMARERMRRRVKPEVLAARRSDRSIDSSLGRLEAPHWVTQDNVFVAIVNKREEEATLLDRLMEALEAWDPSPLRVMMMHARAAMEKAGSLADKTVLDAPRLQAGRLLRILLGKTELERRDIVGELYGRLFERLAHKVEPSIVDFGVRLITSEQGEDPVARAKTLAGAVHNLGADQVYHALNEHISSDVCPDGPMMTGVIFKGLRGDREQYWLCTSPACDLVPGQNLRGWDRDLTPLRPVSVTRLKPVRAAAAISKALEQATIGRHIFLLVDDRALAFEVAEENSRQMELETVLLENDGRIVDGAFRGHVVDLGEGGRPVFAVVDFRVLAKLRPDYANRLLTQSGQQRSRIGVDFYNLPKPPANQA